MTLRERIAEAAFWHEWVCMECGAAQDDEGACENCEQGGVVNAEALNRMVQQLDEGD